MKKRKYAIAIIMATTLILGTGVTAYAYTGLNSQGKIVFKGNDAVANTADDVIFDSGDFDVLENEIILGKKTLAATINSMGNAKFTPNALDLTSRDILFSDLSSQLGRQFEMPSVTSVLYSNRTFGLNLSGSNAGDYPLYASPVIGGSAVAVEGINYLSADSLSAGKTAWNNLGQPVIGNGKKNISAYNDGYTQGVNDERAGLANAQIVYRFHVHTNADGGNTSYEGNSAIYDGSVSMPEISPTQGGCYQTIQYKVHQHTGSSSYGGGCYGRYVPEETGVWVLDHVYGDYNHIMDFHCSNCGACWDDQLYDRSGETHHCNGAYYELNCGKTAGARYESEGIEGYICTCGHTHGELEGAVISIP